MYALDKSLRNKLENAVTRAREVAEEAARSALEQLGVEQSAPYAYLTEEQRELRRKLRAHGRQLGDTRDQRSETQEIERLIEEVAYEHWHRMLFARFLAENQLLMFYEDNDIDNAVSVTLAECEDMALEMGCNNGWELASTLAAKMLPQIFRPESPAFELHFSPEQQKELETLLSTLENEVFVASDSLGWVYQFWQTKKKKAVNESEVKIGARELPAVTQLFTEPYMVSFLLDNSLGAWWTKRRLTVEDLKNAETEDELRNKASLSGIPLEYLRFVKDDNSYWTPAGGTFNGWTDKLSDLKVLDPCCGSGHFLVSAFLMLVPMRMELEGLSVQEACDKVLDENIHGLEIDQRCVEIAAFAVALAAWRYPEAGGFRRLPELQIAWCGQSVNVKKEEWLALAENDSDLRMHLESLYYLFQDAPILGSLLNPRDSFKEGTIFEKDWAKVNKVLQEKLNKQRNFEDGLGVIAQGMEKAFELLGNKYHWVITNVPYLVRGKQNDILKEFCDINYKEAKNDLSTVFLDRCLSFCNKNGNVSVVLPQNWLFLAVYKKFRKTLLINNEWNLIAWLGSGAFDTISGEVVKAILFSININNQKGKISGIETSNVNSIKEKSAVLRSDEIIQIKQDKQIRNPDSMIILDNSILENTLGDFIDSYHGITTTDYPRFGRCFWEIQNIECKWVYQQSTVPSTTTYGGMHYLLLWENGSGAIKELQQAGCPVVITGLEAWGKMGIVVNQMNDLSCAIYTGTAFDTNVAILLPKKVEYLAPVYAFCSSPNFNKLIRKFNQSVKVEYVYFPKVPFDFDYWSKVAREKYSYGLPKPYSDGPTQWVFHGHPAICQAPLQVVVARLLGYRWPAELDKNMVLADEARELVEKCNELLPDTDNDGIVCIPSVSGEASATERVLNLLAIAYRGHDINKKLSELLIASDHMGKSLESWIKDKFFTQHCKLFGHRPFIWHIWDGLSDGFAALVNYHKLDRKNLETLIYTYLGDWINKQKAEIASGVDGAQEKLAAAENLKRNLELILQGEAPYDIFVRWKPVHMQPIGWEPDINDGVRLNIRPFMSVPDVAKKSAGVLREKPNIKWDKDRGKDTESSPWFKEFNGDRINDWHLTLNEKKRARDEKR